MIILHRSLLVLHLLSLAGWLGLSTGAWLLLRKIEGKLDAETLWREFGRIVNLEHVMLACLVASGAGLLVVAGAADLMRTPWFVIKLALLLGVIVPIEAKDIVDTLVLVAQPTPERIAAYRRFIVWAGFAVIGAAIAIVVLAKFRPGV
jgi:putative copper export protein